MPKLCRDTALDAVWHYSSKFVDALNDKCFVYHHKIHNFLTLTAWSEDDQIESNLGKIEQIVYRSSSKK